MGKAFTLNDFASLPEEQQFEVVVAFQRRIAVEGDQIGRDFRKLASHGSQALLQREADVRDITRRIASHQDLANEWQRWAAFLRDNAFNRYFGTSISPHAAASEQRKLIASASELREEANNLSGSATELSRWLEDRRASNFALRSYYFALLALVVSLGTSVVLTVMSQRAIFDWYVATAAFGGFGAGLIVAAFFWRYPV